MATFVRCDAVAPALKWSSFPPMHLPVCGPDRIPRLTSGPQTTVSVQVAVRASHDGAHERAGSLHSECATASDEVRADRPARAQCQAHAAGAELAPKSKWGRCRNPP